MSEHYERMARIEGIDLDTGQFSMILATEGEVSDGHILSIKGGQIPERMPMLNGHYNSATEQLGSITDPQKLLKDSPPRLRAMGHIEMTGAGASADIRRDVAHMIDKGHISGVSIRWDDVPGKSVRRVNLPSDHPHFVDAETEKDHRKRYGFFFEEWIGMEGSVVALQADKEAFVERAQETDGEVAHFWRCMASDAHQDRENKIDFPEEDESPPAKIAASLAGLRIDAADCREAGASHADCINAVTDGCDADIQSVEVGDFVVFLSEPVATVLRERLEADPALEAEVPASLEEVEHLQERLEALEERVAQSDEPAALEEGRETDDPPPSPEPERVEEGAPLPSAIANPNEFVDLLIARLKEMHAPVLAPASDAVVRPHELSEILSQLLGEASERVSQKGRAEIKKARGEISI